MNLPTWFSGQRFRGIPVKSLREMTEEIREQKNIGLSEEKIGAIELPFLTADVVNTTGNDLSIFSILGKKGFANSLSSDDDAVDDPLWEGELPDNNVHEGRFFVLLEDAAASDGVAKGVFSGLVPVLVDIQDESHEFAQLINDDTEKLISAEAGGVRIWAKDSGTGVKWAIVQLGGSSSQPTEFIGIVAAAAPSLTATVSKLRQGADPRTDPSNALEQVPIVAELGVTPSIGDEVWVEGNADGTYSAIKSDSGSTPGTDGLKPDLIVRVNAAVAASTACVLLGAYETTKASLLPVPIGAAINVGNALGFASLALPGQEWVAKWSQAAAAYQFSHELLTLRVLKAQISTSSVFPTSTSFSANNLSVANGRLPVDTAGNDLASVTVDNTTAKISGESGDAVYLVHDRNAGSDEGDQWVPLPTTIASDIEVATITTSIGAGSATDGSYSPGTGDAKLVSTGETVTAENLSATPFEASSSLPIAVAVAKLANGRWAILTQVDNRSLPGFGTVGPQWMIHDGSGSFELIEACTQPFVISVDITGSQLEYTKREWNSCTESTVKIADIGPCPTE